VSKFRRFHIKTIRQSLNAVRKIFPQLNERLTRKREELTAGIIRNIMDAYEYLNGLLDKDIDIFSPAGLYSILELNHIVLCGTDEDQRAEYHRHIMETRRRFQDNIEPIMKWYGKAKKKARPYLIATGFYARALSQPQLFIEGNHRTENIVINYILLSYQEPPLIISPENAYEYFEASGNIKLGNKKSVTSNVFYVGKRMNIFHDVMKQYVDDRFLDD
jgi:hypothetical protein